MNSELRDIIYSQIKEQEPESTDRIIDILFECGASPNNAEEILSAFTLYGITVNTGEDPGDILLQFNAEYRENIREQDERKRTSAIQESLDQLKTIISEYESKGTIPAKDSEIPLQDILKTAHTAIDANNPNMNRKELLKPTTREEFAEKIKNKPPAHETGYRLTSTLAGDKLRFQTGALSIIAAPTGHGKTTMLIDFLLDAAEQYPEKRHWLFSYEEGQESIIIKALNTYCNQDYSENNRRTIESHYKGDDYFKVYNDPKTNTTHSRKDDFLAKEPHFWELVEKGTINIVQADYPTEDLIKIIDTAAEDRPGFIGIDYLQLLYPGDRDSYAARTEELKRICLDLKDTAVREGLAIVAAAQFNREVRYPRDMEAQKLADASDIEKAANKVIGIWNGDKKPHGKEDKEGKKHMKDRGIDQNRVYLEVLKARDERSDIWVTYEYNGNQGAVDKTPIQAYDGPKAEVNTDSIVENGKKNKYRGQKR